MLPRLAAAYLTLNLTGLLFSLWCILFGPWCGAGFILGTIGFFLSIGAWAVAENQRGKAVFGSSGLGLVQEILSVRGLRQPMGVLIALHMFLMIVAVIITFAAWPYGGGEVQVPIFESREHYVLYYGMHGTTHATEVSRLRYVAHGAGFFVGWLGMAALPSLLSLHYVLFGRLPEWLEKRLAKKQR